MKAKYLNEIKMAGMSVFIILLMGITSTARSASET